jgi:hypothetical protein
MSFVNAIVFSCNLKLKSLACLSDEHEYCIHRFAGGTGCQCDCHRVNLNEYLEYRHIIPVHRWPDVFDFPYYTLLHGFPLNPRRVSYRFQTFA